MWIAQVFAITSILCFLNVGAGGLPNCAAATFPVFIYNDKGDSRLLAFDYNTGAQRLVIGGSTMDSEIRSYNGNNHYPLIIQFKSADLSVEFGFTLKQVKDYRIDAVKYNPDASIIFAHMSHASSNSIILATGYDGKKIDYMTYTSNTNYDILQGSLLFGTFDAIKK